MIASETSIDKEYFKIYGTEDKRYHLSKKHVFGFQSKTFFIFF